MDKRRNKVIIKELSSFEFFTKFIILIIILIMNVININLEYKFKSVLGIIMILITVTFSSSLEKNRLHLLNKEKRLEFK